MITNRTYELTLQVTYMFPLDATFVLADKVAYIFVETDLITGIWSLSPLSRVTIVHLVDRSDLFKISNLVYDGWEIGTSLYSSLQGQRQFVVW